MTTFNIIMIAALFFLSGVNLVIYFVLDDDDIFSLFAFGLSFMMGCYNVSETISLLP